MNYAVLHRTGERQVAPMLKQIDLRHKERYKWAIARIQGDNVLDCAAGVGYGSKMIVNALPSVIVTSVDRELKAIQYGECYYNSSRIDYQVQDMRKLDFNKKFDTIVSLESLEHVVDPKVVLYSFKKYLVKEGLLIVSLPIVSKSLSKFHLFEVIGMESAKNFFLSCGFFVVETYKQHNRFGLFCLMPDRTSNNRKKDG